MQGILMSYDEVTSQPSPSQRSLVSSQISTTTLQPASALSLPQNPHPPLIDPPSIPEEQICSDLERREESDPLSASGATPSGLVGHKRKRDTAKDTATPARLHQLEGIIRYHLGTGKFFVVAAALREIDEDQLYKPAKSIYAYAKTKFSFSRRTTNTYLCSASVYESLVEDVTLPIPLNISHIRSLHKFRPEVRRFIWRHVCDSEQSITEEHVVSMTVKYETGVSFTDLNSELYTPKDIISAAKVVIGRATFDLDPASCTFANNLHRNGIAAMIYDEVANGLERSWFGDVWLSPPLGLDDHGMNKQGIWFLEAESKFRRGEINSCFCLLKVDFGQTWFTIAMKYAHCFFNYKLQFNTPTGREKTLPDDWHILIYMGPRSNEFCQKFSTLGYVPGYTTWAYLST